MRKIILLALVSMAVIFGVKAYADSRGHSVGNLDSANILLVEEG